MGRPNLASTKGSHSYEIPNFIDCVFMKSQAGAEKASEADEHIMTIN